MNTNTTLYLSRSAIESWHNCNQLYHYQYHHPDKQGRPVGVQPAKAVRALELGTAAHLAVEYLMRRIQAEQVAEQTKQTLPPVDMNTELFMIVSKYIGGKFHRPNSTADEVWTIKNDVALVYGLVLWFKATVAEEIREQHKVVFVEEEISTTLEIRNQQTNLWQLVMESRPDWATIHKETGDLILWNLKTSKHSLEGDRRIDESFTHDLQGLTEAWAVEGVLGQVYQVFQGAPAWVVNGATLNLPSKVNAIRYVFLVKGDDKRIVGVDGEFNGKYFTNSPLVRGWKESSGGDGWRYAWDQWIDNPENKSGFGKLGKNWEPFTVWEEESLGTGIKTRVEKWVGLLLEPGTVTPLDRVPTIVQVPADKFRSDEDKQQLGGELVQIGIQISEQLQNPDRIMKNRKRCTYPFRCDYFDYCRLGRDIKGAVEGGELVGREPNHPREQTAVLQLGKE